MSTVGTPKSPEQIKHDWDTNPRWKGIDRTYTPADVVALQGSVVEEATLITGDDQHVSQVTE